MKAVIWHNPKCSKSREALALLQESAGIDVEIFEYLKTPPARAEIAAVFKKAGMTPEQGLRMKEEGAKALKGAGDDAILDAMAASPILIERALVQTDKGARLGRPVEKIREIL